jgi:hypothetical protein
LSLTCYSSCGLDAAYLNRASQTPLASFVHLMFEPDLRETYTVSSRLDDVPLSSLGVTTTLWQRADLARTLEVARGRQAREAAWHAARAKLAAPANASERIVETIVADLRRGRPRNPSSSYQKGPA